MSSDAHLINAAANLARTAPQQWRDFLVAMEGYSASKAAELVSSPAADLQIAQGRAQQVAALRRLFAECSKTAERIQKVQQPRSPQSP